MSARKVTRLTHVSKEDTLYLFLVAILGGILVVIGLLCATYELPQRFVEINMQKNLKLSPDSPINAEWTKPSTSIYMRYYIFNVTNAPDIIKGEKPRVRECGPYTYRMYTRKFNVTYYSNDTVSYYNNLTLVFEPSMSVGPESDVLVHLNVPLATLEHMLKLQSPFLLAMGMMQKVLYRSGENHLFENHTVKEIIFGYKHNIFVAIGNMVSLFGQDFDPVFGFFHNFNNSNDGRFLIGSGRRDFHSIHKIDRWNGRKYLPYWSTKYANMINGTDGSFFGPNVKRTDNPYVYFPQMCRSIQFEYEEDRTVKGIHAFRFHFADNLFANSTEEPDNAGFCVPADRCFDSGVLNVASCSDGAPAFVSMPHFYGAAEEYKAAIEGMSPEKEKHDSYFDVEPMTGAALSSDRKLQINSLLKPSQRFEELKNVRETIFPIMWLSGGSEIDDDIAENLRGVFILVRFMDASGYLTSSCGCVVLLIAFVCYLKMRLLSNFLRFRDSRKDNIGHEDENSKQIKF